LLALRSRKPVFLVGAFGGCTAAIIDALVGRKPNAFTESGRLATDETRAVRDLYHERLSPGAERIDYASFTAELERIGVAGLNNGLTPQENERLFLTTQLPEMIALVLRGLSNCPLPNKPGGVGLKRDRQ
jgi:SLOG cluster2